MDISATSCDPGSNLRILVANVLRGNEQTQPLLDLVAQTSPDLVLALETDAVWDRALDTLSEAYPHQVQHIPEDARFYGMHLLSRLPLVAPEVILTFDTAIPAIVTGVALPSGDVVRVNGMHPRPPHLFSQGSTLRDATLLAAGIQAAESDQPSILAGDFNAVPWESAFRRMLRLGGLLDPRVGRGYLSTYSARSALMAWPLDHVVFQDPFAVVSLDRMPGIGSDHYPVLAELCLDPEAASRQSAPALRPNDLKKAQKAFAAAER